MYPKTIETEQDDYPAVKTEEFGGLEGGSQMKTFDYSYKQKSQQRMK